MTTRQSYLEFAPPRTPGLLRGVVLAILAHSLLGAMLTLGVQWKRDAPLVTAEAELWSAIPQEAAPPAMPALPTPEPPPEPVVTRPAPAPEPVAAPTAPQPDPDIAVAREKARNLKEKQLAEKLATEKLEKAQTQKLKEAKEAQVARDKRLAEQLAAEKIASDKKRQAESAKLQSTADAKKLAELRQQNLQRMAGLAGSSGAESSQGTAAQSKGPSAGYAGRIRARIKPNITFSDTVSGNPLADVEVRTSPDGTIISRRIVQSSGIKAWDEAVLSAIDKTEMLPRDADGRVPSVLIIGFRPRD